MTEIRYAGFFWVVMWSLGGGGEDTYPQLRPRVSAIYLFGIGHLWSVEGGNVDGRGWCDEMVRE